MNHKRKLIITAFMLALGVIIITLPLVDSKKSVDTWSGFNPCLDKYKGISCKVIEGETGKLKVFAIIHKKDAPVVFVNPGGPGGSSAVQLIQLERTIPKYIFDNYNFIGIDPKGVNNNNKVICLTKQEEDRINDLNIFQAPVSDILIIGDKYNEMCFPHLPETLSHYSTAYYAKQVHDVKESLKISELNFYTISYGTLLFDYYTALYPKERGFAILDSPVDYASTSLYFKNQLAGLDGALDNFAQWCLTQRCSLGTSKDKILEVISASVALDNKPFLISVALASYFYDGENSYQELYRNLIALKFGQSEKLLARAMLALDKNSDGTYNGFMQEQNIISCADYNIEENSQLKTDYEKIRNKSIFSTLVYYQRLFCANKIDNDYIKLIYNKNTPYKIIYLSNSDDPITPPSMVDNLRKFYLKSKMITLKSNYHGVLTLKSKCIEEGTVDFLLANEFKKQCSDFSPVGIKSLAEDLAINAPDKHLTPAQKKALQHKG